MKLQNLHPHRRPSLVPEERSPSTPSGGMELPNRLLTAFEVAGFVGCHEESVRRAYRLGLLNSRRFGTRNRRFQPIDVLDWIARGAPTRRT